MICKKYYCEQIPIETVNKNPESIKAFFWYLYMCNITHWNLVVSFKWSCEIKGLNLIVYKLNLPHINLTSIIRNNNYDQKQLFPQGNIYQELCVR